MNINDAAIAVHNLPPQQRAHAINEFLTHYEHDLSQTAYKLLAARHLPPNDHDEVLSEVRIAAWEILDGKTTTNVLDEYQFQAAVYTRTRGRITDLLRVRRRDGFKGISGKLQRQEYLVTRKAELQQKLGREATNQEVLDYAQTQLAASGRNIRRQGMQLTLADFENTTVGTTDGLLTSGQHLWQPANHNDQIEHNDIEQSLLRNAYKESIHVGLLADALLSGATPPIPATRWGNILGIHPNEVTRCQEVLADLVYAQNEWGTVR